jgi:hypothetical protein
MAENLGREGLKILSIEQFVDYVNQRAKTGEILTVGEIKQYRSSSYRPVILSQDFAEEIIEQWNNQDPAEYGDPFGLLGCTVEAAESDWLATQSPHFKQYGTMF